ncbi:putative ABC transport system substrate-binding protein [Oxalobacteraceae bacterium GrIS 1.11]
MFLRSLVTFLCLSAVAPTWCRAESAAKPYRIMMMLYRGSTDAEKGFMDYFKRRNIAVEYIVRDAQADQNKIADFVREARELKPDLIYTFGTTVTAEVVGLDGQVDPAKHITDIPVVFDIVADPVGAKLVRNLRSSGRNLTGASHLVPLSAQMNALQTMRKTQTLGVIYNPQEKNSALAVQELENSAAKFGLSLQLAPVGLNAKHQPTTDGIVAALQTLLAKKPQFIYIPSDSFMIKNARMVIQAAQAAHIPVYAATETPIRNDGALLGLVSTYFNVGELAAHKAEQILSGKSSAAQLPVETLNRFTYLVNMSAAKKLSIYPPLAVVKFAELLNPLDAIDARE